MASATSPRVGIIGPGTVGTALARGLATAGYAVAVLYGRNAERLAAAVDQVPGARAANSAQEVVDGAELVFLTVPDDAIRSVAETLVWREGVSAVHCSGVASVDLLRSVSNSGTPVAVFHPLQTLASVEQAVKNLPGSTFAIEASTPELGETLASCARALGGHPVAITGEKALYHASAVLASNCTVALLNAAASLWTDLGLTREEGLRALLPLVRGTIENLESIGLPNALTGPVSRGDLGTVDLNLAALDAVSPETAALYTELAWRTIPIAQEKGTLSDENAARLRARLGTNPSGE